MCYIECDIEMKIIRYCVLQEEHEGENSFKVHRGFPLGNPYTHIKNKQTKALVKVKTREEAIERYGRYFEKSLELNPEFREEFEKMVDACMKYDVVYIGCYCNLNETCHSDYIIMRLKQECRKRMIQKLVKDRKKDAT